MLQALLVCESRYLLCGISTTALDWQQICRDQRAVVVICSALTVSSTTSGQWWVLRATEAVGSMQRYRFSRMQASRIRWRLGELLRWWKLPGPSFQRKDPAAAKSRGVSVIVPNARTMKGKPLREILSRSPWGRRNGPVEDATMCARCFSSSQSYLLNGRIAISAIYGAEGR